MFLEISTLIISVVICLFVFWLGIKEHDEVIKTTSSRISLFFTKSNIRAFNYEATKKMLEKNGVTETFAFINPVNYQICRVILGIVLVVLGSELLRMLGFPYPLAAVLFLPLGFPLGNAIVKWMNQIDNDEMLPDIRKIYDTLKIQSKAGMFLTESLMEVYRVVTHKRLKKALLELNGQLYVKNQIVEAINTFNGKFNNEYIDMLCVTIKQAEQSGQSVRVLNDISNQLVAVQKQIHKKEEDSLNRRLLVVQMMIFVSIIMITITMLIYVLASSLKF